MTTGIGSQRACTGGVHWGRLKELDQKYLDAKGFTDLFKEFGVEYVNITDEIWAGNVIDPDLVKGKVEGKYGPLFTEKLYGFIPEKLYAHRGSSLISFNKFKHYTTFTLKNMFGFIPDPIRCWWHGPKNRRMFKSIIDINKLYTTFFNVLGIQEALGLTPRSNKKGSFGESGMNYELLQGSKLVCAGFDRVEVDTLMAGVGSFGLVELDYLEQADAVLGNYRPDLIEQVKNLSPYPL